MELRETAGVAIMGAWLWIWTRLNGDIKAAKMLAEAAKREALSIEQFKLYMASLDRERAEMLEAQKALVEMVRVHTEKDTKEMELIRRSLAVLEDRAQHRRREDTTILGGLSNASG